MSGAYGGPLIDTFIHHTWASQEELVAYMPRRWQEYIGKPGSLPGGGGAISLFSSFPYQSPDGDRRQGTSPADEPAACSDFETARRRLTADKRFAAGIVGFDQGMLVPTLPNPHLALAIARAANDWMVERWLEPAGSPFHGLILAPNHLPEEAASEIRRVGTHERVVGVLMSGNGLGKRFGNPLYLPIYRAAAELDLTVVVHAGGDLAGNAITQGTPGGIAMTYGEYAALSPVGLMSHLVSMISQGVFEELPNLRVLIVGGGVLWLSSLFWRFDMDWKGLRRDVPWMVKAPSEYFRSNVKVATQPLESAPTPAQLSAALETFPGIDGLLCFASGYPRFNSNTADEVASRLPASWLRRIFLDNALAWFRWSPSLNIEPATADVR
jgi:predicted TIM-barrel fold metal-dependent hydrolase